MGAGLMGAVTVGVYPTSPTPEVAYVVGHADIEIMVCETRSRPTRCWKPCPSCRACENHRHGDQGPAQLAPEVRDLIATFDEVERWRAGASQATIDEALARQTLDDIGLMIYTSGSTGKPKGAMISWRNIAASARASAAAPGADTTHLSYLPLCHVAEQMLTTFCPIYLGSQVNFGESIRTVQEDLREVAPTMFLGVPRIWEKLHAAISIKMQETAALRRALSARLADRAAGRKPRSQLELAMLTYAALLAGSARCRTHWPARGHGGAHRAAPIPPDVVRFFRTLGVPLIEVCGLTESTGMVTGHDFDRVQVGTVGIPTSGGGALPRAATTTWAASSRSRATWCSPGTTKPRGHGAKHPGRLAAHGRRGAPVDGQIKIAIASKTS
jgi:long-chain acyl-CoA synthetase